MSPVPQSSRDRFPACRLELRDLAVRRGERLLFAGLTLRLDGGDGLRLSGANGSGKTSLLRVLAGLMEPEAGTVAWDGEDIALDRTAHGGRCRLVGHAAGLKPLASARENLVFWGRLQAGLSQDEAGAAAEAAAARCQLAGLLDLPAGVLSAGQARRVALAGLLVAPAPLWLLDEPGANLDAAGKAMLRDLVDAQRARGGIVIAAVHGEDLLPDAPVLDMRPELAA